LLARRCDGQRVGFEGERRHRRPHVLETYRIRHDACTGASGHRDLRTAVSELENSGRNPLAGAQSLIHRDTGIACQRTDGNQSLLRLRMELRPPHEHPVIAGEHDVRVERYGVVSRPDAGQRRRAAGKTRVRALERALSLNPRRVARNDDVRAGRRLCSRHAGLNRAYRNRQQKYLKYWSHRTYESAHHGRLLVPLLSASDIVTSGRRLLEPPRVVAYARGAVAADVVRYRRTAETFPAISWMTASAAPPRSSPGAD